MPQSLTLPDYANNKGPMILAIVWTLTITAALFVVFRLAVRIYKLRRLRVDDYIIVASQILSFIFVGFVTAAVRAGGGRHVVTLLRPQHEAATMYITVAFTPGVMSFGLPKLAVISLLIQLLNPSRCHVAVLWTFGVACLSMLVACIAYTYAQCDPPRALWTFDIPGAKCLSLDAVVPTCVVAGAFSAFLDLYLAMYPAIVLWRLEIIWPRKLALSIALGLGVFSCAAGIYKCTTIAGVADKADFTYSTVEVIIWTSIEANCVIIAACIPTLAPLLKIFLGWNPLGPHIRMPTDVYNNYVQRHGTSEPANQQAITGSGTIELGQRRHDNRAIGCHQQ